MNPITLVNPELTAETISRCIDAAIEEGSDYAVFPEYSYCPSTMEDLYKSASEKLTIVGGSYQDGRNRNVAVIAAAGEIYKQDKATLSPYEECPGDDRHLIAGESSDLRLFPGRQRESFAVLTCFDYNRRARLLSTQRANDDTLVSLIFSPSCNHQPSSFYTEADAAHAHRDDMYSILANASVLTVCGLRNRCIPCGGSAVFGLIDNVTHSDNEGNDLIDTRYGNMILRAKPDFSGIITVKLSLPYSRHRPGTEEFVRNPLSIKLLSLVP